MCLKEDFKIIQILSEKVQENGGCAYLVGGCVRDVMLHQQPKDYDIEVHGIPEIRLQHILSDLGSVQYIGKSFGVYHLKNTKIDIALPRRETKIGDGHRSFDISVDPYLDIYSSARRRDFTINAIMQNPLTGEIIDPFNGVSDLQCKILRHVDDNSFPEDPLRVLRGAQFAARFNLTISPKTSTLCQQIDLSSLSSERVFNELKKAVLQAAKPSCFFLILRQINQLDVWFKEVKNLIDIPQNPRFHTEGDVFNHTMMVLDEAANLRGQAVKPLSLMLAALCHDFGKPEATTVGNNGTIHAYGHELRGLLITNHFLHRLTNEKKTIRLVNNLVKLHMRPNILAREKAKIKSTNHMFDEALLPNDLILLALADDRGRISHARLSDTEPFLRKRLALYNEMMDAPYVEGKDLIAAGLKPGTDFSDILAYAHKLRLAGIEKASALKQTLGYAKKLRRKNQKNTR